MKRTKHVMVSALALLALACSQKVDLRQARENYLVQLVGDPLASYAGDEAGFAATKADAGAKLDVRSTSAVAYLDHLHAQYQAVLQHAGVADGNTLYQYGTAFNGFAARLTSAEALALEGAPGVVRVMKSYSIELETISTPRFLGIDGPSGVWATQFGGSEHAGEGMIIGLIDSGFWPEHPSFAALPEPRPDKDSINWKWRGSCDPGQVAPVTCNNKVLGARYYGAGGLPKAASENLSPRDTVGHGTFTASIAAGNHNVPVEINGIVLGQASGVAPAARLAIYKAAWTRETGSSTADEVDVIAAVDQAVADGVDVINYSIGHLHEQVTDPINIAFLHAASAGVFIAAAAGNSGPGKINNIAPWVTTVAASTHDRQFGKSVILGNGATYTGLGTAPPAVDSTGLVDSAAAALPPRSASDAEFCVNGALDPAKVTGKIVLCRRGGPNLRVDKSAEVKRAGGAGMVLYDSPDTGLVADFHSVPTVHVNNAAGLAIKAYIALAPDSATASLSAGFNPPVRAPAIASISASGPAYLTSLLKPDLTAPGVDVLAATAPPAAGGALFSVLSGTSTSTPQVAGTAALLMAKHPFWSPMSIKSALLTSASSTDNTGAPIQRGNAAATPWDLGSGHLRPAAAFDPGLVYESGLLDWLRYTCSVGELQELIRPNVCVLLGASKPSDYNSPMIAAGELLQEQTVVRRVTNVTSQPATYTSRLEVPPGFSVTVTPAQLSLRPRQTATFQVKIQNVSSPIGVWSYGALTWADNTGHTVRSPIAVRQWTVTAPDKLTLSGTTGSETIAISAGYSGQLTATSFGLAPSMTNSVHLVGYQTNFRSTAPAAGPAAVSVDISVPPGSKFGMAATYNADHTHGADVDLYVYQIGATGGLTLVGFSDDARAEESVEVPSPGGDYRVFVVKFRPLPDTSQPDELDAKLHFYTVSSSPPANFSVTPASLSVLPAVATHITASWSQLVPGTRYLGLIEYGDGTTTFSVDLGGRTLITAGP